MAVTAAQRQSAQLHLRRWQSQRRQSLLRFAQAQSKSALALFKRLASKPEPSQCPEQRSGAAATGAVAPASVAVNAADLQRHWLHCTCQPIVSRTIQLRPCSSWVPYGSHSGAAATGAAAPASVAITAAAIAPALRHWLHSTCQPIVSRSSCDLGLAGCHMAVTAAQRQSALLHLTCVGGSSAVAPASVAVA